jgi:hypothetical protein
MKEINMFKDRLINFVLIYALCLPGVAAQAATPFPVVEITPDRFLNCKADTDCTAVEHRCGGWSIVNTAGKQEIYRVASYMDNHVICTPNRTKKPFVTCQYRYCAVAGYYQRPLSSAWQQ